MVGGMNGTLADELARERILAIVRGSDPEAAIRTAVTLMECGIRILEVSLVTADALRVISEIVKVAPDGCLIGAGTVLSRSEVAAAAKAGARFMVTPALADSVAESVALGIPVLAGAFTPSEVVRALDLGADVVKLFPMSLGGPAYLRALRGPFPTVPFVPVGGSGCGHRPRLPGIRCNRGGRRQPAHRRCRSRGRPRRTAHPCRGIPGCRERIRCERQGMMPKR